MIKHLVLIVQLAIFQILLDQIIVLNAIMVVIQKKELFHAQNVRMELIQKKVLNYVLNVLKEKYQIMIKHLVLIVQLDIIQILQEQQNV
jgi:hypothetical protein